MKKVKLRRWQKHLILPSINTILSSVRQEDKIGSLLVYIGNNSQNYTQQNNVYAEVSAGSYLQQKKKFYLLGYIGRRPIDAPIRRVEKIDIEQGKKLRGRSKMTWMEVVKKDMNLLELEERMVADRNVWRRKIYILDRI